MTGLFLRLRDRKKWPRRWWWPTVDVEKLPASEDDWKRQHDEVSTTIRRVMVTLIGYSFFCLLTLAAPDERLISRDATIKIPFAGTDVDYGAFLLIGPAVLIGLTIYLHIFLERWWVLTYGPRQTVPLPFIFNMDNLVPRWLSAFLFYWLPTLTLLAFAAKASARPGADKLILITLATACVLIWLQIRRCPYEKRKRRNIVLWPVFLGLAFTVVIVFRTFVIIGYGPPSIRVMSLYKADLHEQDLERVHLYNADLRRANLSGANLRKARLSGANLQGADLSGARLQQAELLDANLQGVNLRGANLWGAHLWTARLQEAYLRDANLQEADLAGANLTGANLRDANLKGANLTGANLTGAKLIVANLKGANLDSANLAGASLAATNLKGANLRKAKGVTASQIRQNRTWELAFYSDDLLTELGLPADHNETVKKKLAK